MTEDSAAKRDDVPLAVLDACVLANARVANLLLTLAEASDLYAPAWSDEILAEVKRTHLAKLNWPSHIAESWQRAATSYFPKAMVRGYEPWIERCRNHVKDRHVLAAGIRAKASVIVTYNMKDFRAAALREWRIDAMHPDAFLLMLLDRKPFKVLHGVTLIANRSKESPEAVIDALRPTLPKFCHAIETK